MKNVNSIIGSAALKFTILRLGIAVSILQAGISVLAVEGNLLQAAADIKSVPTIRREAGPLLTRWARDISSERVWPEYPRPQLVRKEWMNLNGPWDFALQPRDAARPAGYDRVVLVPFPVESALSGVQETVSPKHRLWYRRSFDIPDEWAGRRIRLNFGAVDWEAVVWLNGVEIGTHRGGYDAFSFDITDALTPNGKQEIVISVWDPSDAGQQPHGKQFRTPPSATRYTAASGIWQTVWLEPVNQMHITAVKITPDIDKETVSLKVQGSGQWTGCSLAAEVYEAGVMKSAQTVKADQPLVLPVINPKLWSPESPFLYDVQLTLRDPKGNLVDKVTSYFGMRKIDVATAPDGYKRIRLNNKFYFQLGFLDQGYWPDGIYTAPSDEALRYDIEAVKKVGCNMVRKHVKIEPQRWYYWCDKLGLLVWQDMVNGKQSEEGRTHYERELKLMIEQHYNHPSIVMWVPFNEGWGQHGTPRIYQSVKKWDPTRLVNVSSGGKSQNTFGEVSDMHNYPGPAVPVSVPHISQPVSVLGEFGGLGLMVKDHTWHKLNKDRLRGFSVDVERRTDPLKIEETPWGTGWVIPLNLEKKRMRNDWKQWDKETYIREYAGLYAFIPQLRWGKGLDAAVYTQLTDVENELNGILTYDRIFKAESAQFAQIHQQCLRQQQHTLNIKNSYLEVTPRNQVYQVQLSTNEKVQLFQPDKGLWSVAMDRQDDWPANWHHGSPETVECKGPWLILNGTIKTEKGNWRMRDAYIAEGRRIRCVRRWQWTGKEPAMNVTLSVRWLVPAPGARVMMPGFCIYGNPSGSADRVAKYTGQPGEELYCEEHRLTTRLDFDASVSGQAAGLCMYHDPGMNFWLTTTNQDGKRVFEVGKTNDGKRTSLWTAENTIGPVVHLRIDVDGEENATFYYGPDGEQWSRLGESIYFGDSWQDLRNGRGGDPDLGWIGVNKRNAWSAGTFGLFAVRGPEVESTPADFDFLRVTTGENPYTFQATLHDELEPLFPDSTAPEAAPPGPYHIDAARGTIAGVHILLADLPVGAPLRLQVTGSNEWLAPATRFYRLLDVPVEANSGLHSRTEKWDGKHNPHVIRRAPFRIFEVLRPAGPEEITDHPVIGMAAQMSIPCEAAPGEYTVSLQIQVGDHCVLKEILLRVYSATVPPIGKNTLRYTNWYSLDNMLHGTKARMWSEEFWEILDRYAAMMAKGRQNTIRVPFWSELDAQGRVVLHRERMKRLIAIFEKHGIHYIEGSHLVGARGDNLVTRLGGHPVQTAAGIAEVVETLLRIREFIDEEGLRGRWLQHIRDEPPASLTKDYLQVAGLIHQHLPGVPVVEATVTRSLVGGVDIWCPTVDEYQRRHNFFDERKNQGEEVWVYTCLTPTGPWINRLLDMERLRQVYIGWGAARFGTKGFLHWALNRFSADPFEQSVIDHPAAPNTNNQLPAGDTHILYPGPGEPWASTRFEAHRIGLEDLELLQQLQGKDPELWRDIVVSVFRGYDDYEKDVHSYRLARQRLLAAVSEQGGTCSE